MGGSQPVWLKKSNSSPVPDMGWKRNALELATRLCGMAVPHFAEPPREPGSIFVLRNNDIGDLLVVTPLFEALKRKFPRAKIVAGIGTWNFDVLKNNPFVDEVLPVNAPWHNGQVRPQGLRAVLRYIAASDEAKNLAKRRFEIGIDVLGSPFGSMLLMRCGIPFRMGVKGYGGGHSTVQRCVTYDRREHIGRSALRFAELLGATDLPENRSQIFLDGPPVANGSVVLAPGGGFLEKCWPVENYIALARMLAPRKMIVVGGEKDRLAGSQLAGIGGHVEDLTGRLSLHETFGVIAGCELVVCNSSMAMHAAAAFHKPCYVLLGEWYSSAGAHADQWAHPETRMFGRDTNRARIFTPQEAHQHIRAALDSQ